MRIWIITSNFDQLSLFKILSKYDFEYHILRDWNNWPYWDKDFEYNLDNIKRWVDFLKKKKVDYIILPPIYELYFQENKVLPLFTMYLAQALQKSLIGKIWFLWDFADMQVIEKIFYEITKNYQLTENQQQIENFHYPFALWKKETTLWKFYLYKLGFRDSMVCSTIKNDLKYFKDANVDTIIPLNRGYLFWENVIKSKLNPKKQKFHWTKSVQLCRETLVDLTKQEKYAITIYPNGNPDFLLREKKRLWLLERGKNISAMIDLDSHL